MPSAASSTAALMRPRRVAVIRETECIGCTKCLPACPEDAIRGAPKQIHVVLHDKCTGCDLCLDPCPVNCIDMVSLPLPPLERVATATPATNLSKAWLIEDDLPEPPPRPLINRTSARKEIAAAVARMNARRKLSD